MKIYTQSVFEKWPLEDKSIQAIITSPPYYSLRHYDIPDTVIGGDGGCEHDFKMSRNKILNLQAGNPEFKRQWREEATTIINHGGYCIHCSAWKGQYGLELSYKDYIEHTVLWAKEAWRVLRDDGIFFLNIGDSYPSGGGKAIEQSFKRQAAIDTGAYPDDNPSAKLRKSKPKCKLMIPHRIAIALIDEGWTLRNDIIWEKGNSLPESVQDRFSKKYENIFMFVKNPKRYYFNLDAVRVPWEQGSVLRLFRGVNETNKYNTEEFGQSVMSMAKPRPNRTNINVDIIKDIKYNNEDFGQNIQGKITGHSGYFDKDGNFIGNIKGKNPGDIWKINTQPSSIKHYAMMPQKLVERMLLCSTKEGDTVLDPFAGSATTLKVAIKNNREAIGIDLGYEDIQEENLKNIQINLL